MSSKYFNKLNYTLANEDTALELELLPEDVGHLFSVAGSGGRILPLLAKRPRLVTCVDLADEQLYLAEMRFASARELSHSEFLAFWGYPPAPASRKDRRELFHRLGLSEPAKKFLEELFKEKNWDGILYEGKWERTFAKLSEVNRRITGAKGAGLFSALTDAEHFDYLEKRFPRKTWLLVLFILGNATIFNALLYKGHFPKKNLKDSFFDFYVEAFDRLFEQGPARRNFFLQLAFFGKVIFSEGCPIECDPKVFELAKGALQNTEIRYCRGDILAEAQKVSRPIDFFSISDVPSYFSGETERLYLQKVAPTLNPGALVVIRHYLHVTENTDKGGFEDVTSRFDDAIDREKLQVYQVEILRRLG
ncbi:MAG: hypothetical protein A2428_16850 [Bdellovibrionales bacterium RIFOXYC1_FULL_54_43]|nr:MAG: hypothetical protein A2428_16850 [Bdellovibrionales bacterium RIFOXYC1_FULL_54_43]OFZ82350.1 MAG: hypothetical protein A2603_03720 [Bdellovibrionales bacterium RIFOXYD1_FULL_55_31]